MRSMNMVCTLLLLAGAPACLPQNAFTCFADAEDDETCTCRAGDAEHNAGFNDYPRDSCEAGDDLQCCFDGEECSCLAPCMEYDDGSCECDPRGIPGERPRSSCDGPICCNILDRCVCEPDLNDCAAVNADPVESCRGASEEEHCEYLSSGERHDVVDDCTNVAYPEVEDDEGVVIIVR